MNKVVMTPIDPIQYPTISHNFSHKLSTIHPLDPLHPDMTPS